MFLRKFFSKNSKFNWILVDLVIVFIGVYGAFAIQKYADDQKTAQERERVLSALKIELEFFGYRMYETSLGMDGMLSNLKNTQEKGEYSNFSNFRFIEPQYDYQTVQYAINQQNSEVVDFELYNVLQSLFVELKKIEHVERLLTDTSRKYRSIPENLALSEAYYLLQAENLDNFNRFVTLVADRKEISGRIAIASRESLPIINERLGQEKAREVERQIIADNAVFIPNEEEAVKLARRFFPKLPEEEIRQIYREAKK